MEAVVLDNALEIFHDGFRGFVEDVVLGWGEIGSDTGFGIVIIFHNRLFQLSIYNTLIKNRIAFFFWAARAACAAWAALLSTLDYTLNSAIAPSLYIILRTFILFFWDLLYRFVGTKAASSSQTAFASELLSFDWETVEKF